MTRLGMVVNTAKRRCFVDNLTVNAVEDDFQNIFKGALGVAQDFEHKVRVNMNVPPKQQKLRRLPLTMRDQVKNKIVELKKQGIIEKVESSEWVSPIVVAMKKDGDIRICVDLREVNRAVIPDTFPLPHLEDLLSSLSGATVFSKIDLKSAYHQIPLHEDSKHLTTFITHCGLYRYNRVCFGLASAPSAFQRIMSQVLEDLAGVLCYLDDILVFGSTVTEHDERLRAVLERIKSTGLTLNDKCQFHFFPLTN